MYVQQYIYWYWQWVNHLAVHEMNNNKVTCLQFSLIIEVGE